MYPAYLCLCEDAGSNNHPTRTHTDYSSMCTYIISKQSTYTSDIFVVAVIGPSLSGEITAVAVCAIAAVAGVAVVDTVAVVVAVGVVVVEGTAAVVDGGAVVAAADVVVVVVVDSGAAKAVGAVVAVVSVAECASGAWVETSDKVGAWCSPASLAVAAPSMPLALVAALPAAAVVGVVSLPLLSGEISDVSTIRESV